MGNFTNAFWDFFNMAYRSLARALFYFQFNRGFLGDLQMIKLIDLKNILFIFSITFLFVYAFLLFQFLLFGDPNNYLIPLIGTILFGFGCFCITLATIILILLFFEKEKAV